MRPYPSTESAKCASRREGDFPYFGPLRNRMIGRFLAAAIVPAAAIAFFLYWRDNASIPLIGVLFLLYLAWIIVAVFLFTGELIRLLEVGRSRLKTLDLHLRRISHASSSMELAQSQLQEVKDTLANIDSGAVVLRRDMETQNDSHSPAILDEIRSEARRGLVSLDRFLEYIRPEPPLIREVNLHDLIEDLIGILGRTLRFRNIEIRRSFQADPPIIRSDRAKLRQVFQNLVLNAVDALGTGGVLSISSSCNGNQVSVILMDDGPGIAESDLPRIFEPLWTSRRKGAGLGLPLCRDILDRLGGSIEVVSNPGEGTKVTVTLPGRFTGGATSGGDDSC